MRRIRPLLSRDLPRCVELARLDGARGPLLDAPLLDRLLDKGLLIGRVIEERSATTSNAIVRGYGLSALVRPEAAGSARASQIPDLVARLLCDAAGIGSPFLDRRNASSLGPRGTRHMLVLNFAIDASAEDKENVTALLHAAFIEAHSGHALASLTTEVRPWESKAETYRQSLRAMGCGEAPVDARLGTQVF